MAPENALEFRPIDLFLHLEVALRFIEDAYICSFGDASRFHKEEYIDWLRTKIATDRWSGVHVWLDGQIIGQMEISEFKQDPTAGYINLYYLIPEQRGKGLSRALDEFAVSELRRKGYSRAFLSVSPTNERAWHYYRRLGWQDLGQRAEAQHVHLMAKCL